MILNDPMNHKGLMFDKDISRVNLMRFVNENLSKKKFKMKSEGVEELSKERFELGTCGAKDKNFCVVALVSNKSELKPIRASLKKLGEDYESDNVSFYYIQSHKINQDFHKTNLDQSSIFILRGKRSKFTGLSYSLSDSTVSQLSEKIDYLLAGNLRDMKKRSSL